VLEIYDCRIVLEGMAAEWAARMRTDYDLAEMEGAISHMSKVRRGSAAEQTYINQIVHEKLWQASHNSTLFDLLKRLDAHTRRYPESTVSQPGRWDEVIREHREIFDAIRDRDAERAK